jgi:hypothetical protein
VRPILCHKIRYFLRPVFLRRMRPAPKVPRVKPIAAAPTAPVSPPEADRKAASHADAREDTPKPPAGAAAERDLDIDAHKVVPPTKAEDEPLNREELDTAVESFISAFKQR